MKVTIPVPKPRAKWLNDILLSKRSERHADTRNPSRSIQKRELNKQLKDLI